MALSRLSLSRAGTYNSCLRAFARGNGGKEMAKLCERPQCRELSWFSGRGERPRRSQSRVLSGDDGHIFMIESEFKTLPLLLVRSKCPNASALLYKERMYMYYNMYKLCPCDVYG